MKIGILTYYDVHNHGAVLQANALKTVLERAGHEVTFLKFERNYDFMPAGSGRKYSISIFSVPYYLKYLCKNGVGKFLYNVRKRALLNGFRKENFRIETAYNEFDGEIAIVGSDEVFSVEVGVNPFFYGHGVSAPQMFSYAASFGPTTQDMIEKHGLETMLRTGLQRFSAVSVRDHNSKEIVERTCGSEAVLVCDPVILYGYEAEQRKYEPKLKNYLLVYSYDKNMNDPHETEAICRWARSKGWKVVSVGYYHDWCDLNINATPEELLGWIRKAEFVVTDTFHGSVLSLICNTQFAVKLRNNKNKVQFLLEEYGLGNRVLSGFEQLEELRTNGIDYSAVNRVIEQNRARSEAFLGTQLEKSYDRD